MRPSHLVWLWVGFASLVGGWGSPLFAQPTAAEIPVENPSSLLRQLNSRSPIDNQELSPSEYAILQQELQEGSGEPPPVSPQLQNLITLLKLRKVLRSISPF